MNLVLKPVCIDVVTGPASQAFSKQLKAHAKGKELKFSSEEVDFLTLFLIEVTDDLLPTIIAKAKVHGAHWREFNDTVRSNNRSLIV